MGALTVAIDNSAPTPVDPAVGYQVRGTFTFSNSYATGGDTFTAAQIGLVNIERLLVGQAKGFLAEYVASGPTVKAYEVPANPIAPGALVEVAATSDLSSVTVPFVAWGI